MSAPDLNTLSLPELYRVLARGGAIYRLLALARDEDLGRQRDGGDVTSDFCIPEDAHASFRVVLRERGVISGLSAVPELLQLFAPHATFEPAVADGDRCKKGALLGTLSGPTREVLCAERTLLNLIGRLSGVATRAAEFVRAVEGTGAVILDTRKTTPGLRVLEKYAARCGGAHCHRLGLHDAVLVKDNHIAGVPLAELPARITQLAKDARGWQPDLKFVEVEVDSLEQFNTVLGIEVVDIVLLDNFNRRDLRTAVRRRDKLAPTVKLEASGGVTLETVLAIAETGVDRVSVGSITHGARSLDVGLDA